MPKTFKKILMTDAAKNPLHPETHTQQVRDDQGHNIEQLFSMLKDGTFDSSGGLPADRDNLKKIADALAGLKGAVDTFLSGTPDAGTIDRLSELVAAIQANKDTIDALLTDKIDKEAIYDGLDSADAGKVLSAAQGKALKELIDALSAKAHEHANKSLLDNLGQDAESRLTLGGKPVNEGKKMVAFLEEGADIPADVDPNAVIFWTPKAPV